MAHIRRAKTGRGWEARYRDPMGKERGARSLPARRRAVPRSPVGRHPARRLCRPAARERRSRSGQRSGSQRRFTSSRKRRRATSRSFANESFRCSERLASLRSSRSTCAASWPSSPRPATSRARFATPSTCFVWHSAPPLRRGRSANPCTGVRMPRSTRAEMLFLEPEQILALADSITPAFSTLVLVAAYTACAPARSRRCASAASTCCAEQSTCASLWPT